MKDIIKKIIKLLPDKFVEKCFHINFPNAIVSYSQNGEDILLNNHIFQNKENGFYIDIGSHHPRQFSNTYLLYKRGWSGINIDPIPNMKKIFEERVRDLNINAGISDHTGKIKYYAFTKGTLNTFDEETAKKQSRMYGEFTTHEMQVYTLKEIITKHAPEKQIDFMNIDVEGFELKILNSHDWVKYPPTLIAIEDQNLNLSNPSESTTYLFLTTKGYELFSKVNYTTMYRKLT